ncbi:MAG: hypothetical protein IAF38_00955, partial [Bacteroidia bacterium]|nr:hypothetical protein [Bacteroidia bacterium]
MKAPLLFSKKLIICVISILGFSALSAQCDWEAVGPDDDQFFIEEGGTLYKPAIASDNNGVQYVAYTDGGSGDKISVKRYVNEHWTYVGPRGFSPAKADYVKIATDNLNRVYVAYQDYANGNRLTVQFYNGFSWNVIGTPGMGNDTTIRFDLCVDKSTSRPLVFFTDSVDISTVMEFNGSTWNVLGATNFAQSNMYEIEISSNNGTPYLSYISYGPSTLNVLKFNGTAWVSAGAVPPSFVNAGWNSAVTFDINDVPHIAFEDITASSHASVMYLNAGVWNYLGTPGIAAYSTWYHNLAFDQSNNAFLSCTKIGGAAAQIFKYNGTSWNLISTHLTPTNAYITSQYAYYRDMSIDPITNDLYMLYTESTATPLMGWKDYG